MEFLPRDALGLPERGVRMPAGSRLAIPFRGLFGNPDNLWEELSLGPVLAVGWVV